MITGENTRFYGDFANGLESSVEKRLDIKKTRVFSTAGDRFTQNRAALEKVSFRFFDSNRFTYVPVNCKKNALPRVITVAMTPSCAKPLHDGPTGKRIAIYSEAPRESIRHCRILMKHRKAQMTH
jgi:hypothetical protein